MLPKYAIGKLGLIIVICLIGVVGFYFYVAYTGFIEAQARSIVANKQRELRSLANQHTDKLLPLQTGIVEMEPSSFVAITTSTTGMQQFEIWAFHSDRTDVLRQPFDAEKIGFYDPTNGTRSAGEVATRLVLDKESGLFEVDHRVY